MRRRHLVLGLLGGAAMTTTGISTLSKLLQETSSTDRMPILFVGHGSPMNAIDNNSFTKTLNKLGDRLPTPNAILVVSAHWMTQGTWVTQMDNPKTIHDFYGFPKALFDIQYPAPGSREVAELVKSTVNTTKISGDENEWGLDHGTWAVLRHIYPKANIPVLQLSLDMTQGADYHFRLGQQLRKLRDKGVLILASGNLVHNLRAIRWEANAKSYDWAMECDEWMKSQLLQRNYEALVNDFHKTEAGRLSIPSLDHYFPLHYILGASISEEPMNFEYEEIQNGSISMRSLSFGLT